MPRRQVTMLNWRVGDLDAMLDQLRAADVRVEDRIEESEQGRFGWAYDLEGNKFELLAGASRWLSKPGPVHSSSAKNENLTPCRRSGSR